MAMPIKISENGVEKKKITETIPCGAVDSGNIPMHVKAHPTSRLKNVPQFPGLVRSTAIFRRPMANVIPRSPAMINPTFNIMDAEPWTEYIGLSPSCPPRSLIQFSVQLNQGDMDTAIKMQLMPINGARMPHNPTNL